LEVARRDHTLVLPAADIHDAQSNTPWVLVAESGRARRRQVKLGLVDIGKVEILDGLRASELVGRRREEPGNAAPRPARTRLGRRIRLGKFPG
jgi:hypothetical protein